jgi:TonB-dependent receptor
MKKHFIHLLTIKTFTVCYFFASAYSVKGQNGVIMGNIIDTVSQTGAFVDITLLGKKQLFATPDSDGKYIINELPTGTYSLMLTGDDYDTLKYNDLIINDNDTLVLYTLVGAKIKVDATRQTLETTVFRAARNTNTNNAIIEETRNANQVANGISQEEIKNSQDKNAAQVMSRIPGITVVDGKFIMVRGIPERYNQVLLNNIIAPSTEVDKRTFSFDLIPSNVLDRMVIYKSGAPENTGDFAGGLIKVYTSNAIEDNQSIISLNIGYRQGTTFNDYIQSDGSKTDILGFDNGFRQLPYNFPTYNLRNLPNKSTYRIQAAQTLPNNFNPQDLTALPDISAGYNISRKIHIRDMQLNTISGINYSQSYQTYNKLFQRYLEIQPDNIQAIKRFSYNDNYNEKENKIGLISNWKLQINSNNQIEFKNLFNQIGENISVLRNGEDYIQQAGLKRKNYMYQYRSRTIYTGQLEGTHKHTFAQLPAKLNWVIGLNYLFEDQPDLRRFRTIQSSKNNDNFRMILPPSSNLYDAGRFYSQLHETGFNNSINYVLDLNKNKLPIHLKMGYMLDFRNRRFDTRYFSYLYPGNSSLEALQSLELESLDKIFHVSNMNLDNGFSIEEGTRSSDSYTASNFLGAGYTGIVLPLGKLTLSGGIRMEYNIQQLNTTNDASQTIKINNAILSPLGFINVDYDVYSKSKLRFAYYQAVNRPEFRELAPFLFYDYQFDAEKYGNPNLKTANINNFDLRYEYYPRKGEIFSIGAFYKQFNNPIETQILIRSESPAFSYQNAALGYSRGLELEFRKSFQGLTSFAFIDKLSINFNAAFIHSQVDYGKNSQQGQDTKRALQGQSPYIFNTTLSYSDKQKNFQISASYNVLGKRIYAVGSILFPTIYEMPRHALDLTISKRIYKNCSIKFGIQDMLNFPHRFYQDTDRNDKISMNRMDEVIFNYKKGTLYTLGFNYTFK